ncbi:MAG TPA: signal peptidase II [Vicinamibacterales bacterium]|jgi:signal peptidase II
MIQRTALRLTLLVAVISTIGCDRVTKHIASEVLAGGQVRTYLADTIRLEYAENTGGFLGLGANLPDAWRTTLFTIATGIVLAMMAVLALCSRWNVWQLTGACLVIAGGASNWIDRVVRGSVIDFMNVGIGPLRTGVFNVADVAIMAGIAAITLARLRR